MAKPLRCLLGMHQWRYGFANETAAYRFCVSCGQWQGPDLSEEAGELYGWWKNCDQPTTLFRHCMTTTHTSTQTSTTDADLGYTEVRCPACNEKIALTIEPSWVIEGKEEER